MTVSDALFDSGRDDSHALQFNRRKLEKYARSKPSIGSDITNLLMKVERNPVGKILLPILLSRLPAC